MKYPLCIYHGHCNDGFTAAWVVRRAIPGCELYAGIHQDPPPEASGRDVILVDFSYRRPVLEALARAAASLLIIDHHKTAIEELGDLRSVRSLADHMAQTLEDKVRGIEPSWHAYFDLKRSGAGLTWDFFFPGEQRPAFIERIEDRDLWRFVYPDTRAVTAAVDSYPRDLKTWDSLLKADLASLRAEGEAIERRHQRDITELLGMVTRRMWIGGYNVPIANLPSTFSSDAGHRLAEGEPFGGCYWDTPQGRVFSLRSTDAGVDVSEIAKQYGGGGHRNASGFRVSYEQARTFELSYR